MYNNYQLPKEIKTEAKIFKSIYLKDIYILVGVFILTYVLLQQFVPVVLQVFFTIFVIGVTLYLMLPSKKTVKKRNIHLFLFFIVSSTVNSKYLRGASDVEKFDK